jgi:RNA polymerase sigma-70 factor (ECF subfamily)
MEPSSAARTSASLLARLGRAPADGAAWEEFLRRYQPRILQWCRRWGLQEADAQDVTQNVLLRLTRQMETFRYDPSRRFRAWLKAVAHGAWCDWLGSRPAAAQGSGDTAVFDQLGTVEAGDSLAAAIEEEYDRELLQAASVRVRLRVEPHTWEAFRLLAFDGLSGAEAAPKTGMSVAAAFVAKSKVQKMLRQEIETLEAEDSA